MTNSRSKSFKNPPIEEAVIEFRFEKQDEWDPTIPGRLHEHEKIKPNYAGKPREQHLRQARMLKDGQGPMSGFMIETSISRTQLLDQTGTRLLTVGPDALSVNSLKPYEGWEQFRVRVQDALHAYTEVAPAEGNIARVGVRYINKIVIPNDGSDLDDYFVWMKDHSAGLSYSIRSFQKRMEYSISDGQKLLGTLASIDSDSPDVRAYLLDIDVSSESTSSFLEVMAVVEQLHSEEKRFFDAMLTAKLKEMFNAD